MAVDHFDMHVERGAIYGFVGRNGAGKSTVIKLLAGLALPTSGESDVLGKTVGKELPDTNIGVLVESPGLYLERSGQDNMMMQALAKGVIEPKKECAQLLTYVGLAEVAKKKVRKYSMGMKQRLGLAIALLGNPSVLLLDEPLNGLDPESVRDMRKLIIQLNQERGVTVLLSSHILGQLERMATHYGVIRQGTMVREFSAATMEEECRDYVRLRAANTSLAVALLNEHIANAQCRVIEEETIEIRGEHDTTRIANLLNEANIAVHELHVCSRDTEDFFVTMMGGEQYV